MPKGIYGYYKRGAYDNQLAPYLRTVDEEMESMADAKSLIHQDLRRVLFASTILPARRLISRS